jgi:hypothetical protein
MIASVYNGREAFVRLPSLLVGIAPAN